MVKWVSAVFIIMMVATGAIFMQDMKKSFLPQFMMIDKAPIDPYCIGMLATQMDGTRQTEPLSLASCKKEGRNAYTSHFGQNGQYFFQTMERAEKNYTDRMTHSYHFIGGKEDRFYVATTMNGGGTGQFSSILAIKRDGDTLVYLDEYAGGDRCFGGIEDATLGKDGTLSYGRFVTSADLYEHEKIAEKERLSDLSFCAVCCIGTVDYKNHTATGYTINPDTLTIDEGMNPQQVCFNKALLTHIKDKGHTLSKEVMHTFLNSVTHACQS